MPRPTRARIDADALRHNYRRACDLAGGARVMAVVKADGYGHGLARVAGALAGDAPCFAVACLEEALVLRQTGLSQPVVLLEGVHEADDLKLCTEQGFEVVIHSPHQLDWLARMTRPPTVWLKVNTGMNRLGFAPAQLTTAVSRVRQQGAELTGLMTHFACADDDASASASTQTEVFRAAAGPWPGLRLSAGNSAAHFRNGQALFDWSRPGIMLYGASPMLGKTGPELGLQPAMILESEIIAVRDLAAGDAVGYGETWRAPAAGRMGVVCIGYGDGYPRHAGNGTPVAVRGERVPLIGRVSMDMLAVDLSRFPEVMPGDRVELWGPEVSVDEVAAAAGTISYQLLTGVTQRVPRCLL